MDKGINTWSIMILEKHQEQKAGRGYDSRLQLYIPSSCNEVDSLFHLIHQSSTLQNIFMRDIILCIGFTVQCDAVNVLVFL